MVTTGVFGQLTQSELDEIDAVIVDAKDFTARLENLKGVQKKADMLSNINASLVDFGKMELFKTRLKQLKTVMTNA